MRDNARMNQGVFYVFADWVGEWNINGQRNSKEEVEKDIARLESCINGMKNSLKWGEIESFERSWHNLFGVAYNEQAVIKFLQNRTEANRKAVFGDSCASDIQARVNNYQESQVTVAGYAKDGVKIMGAMTGPLGSAVTSFTVDAVDAWSSGQEFDVLNATKDAVIGAAAGKAASIFPKYVGGPIKLVKTATQKIPKVRNAANGVVRNVPGGAQASRFVKRAGKELDEMVYEVSINEGLNEQADAAVKGTQVVMGEISVADAVTQWGTNTIDRIVGNSDAGQLGMGYSATEKIATDGGKKIIKKGGEFVDVNISTEPFAAPIRKRAVNFFKNLVT